MEVKADDYVFRNVSLLHGRTEMAEMMPSRKMKHIEDVSEQAVPVSTDLDGTVKGAQKCAQLGQDAMEKILEAATQDIIMTERSFMIIFEINMLCGDLLDAYVEKRQGLYFPTYFVTASGSEHHIEWWNFTKRDLLENKFLDGKLLVAGYSALPKEVPQDVMEKPPTAPQLGKIVIKATGTDQTLSIPEAIIKQWYHHPLFGTRFRAFADQFYEESFCASLSLSVG